MQTPTYALLPFALLAVTLTACASTSPRSRAPIKSVGPSPTPTVERASERDVDEAPIAVVDEAPTDEGPTLAEAPPPTADEGPYGQPVASPSPDEASTEVRFDAVHFRTDSAELDSDAITTLDKLAEHLEDNDRLRVTIEGHCDERGTEAYNLALGHARAEAIKTYLIGLGVDGERVSTVSYGEERPVSPGRDRESLADNRRGEFVLFGEGANVATADVPSS
jgi:peptidoglycan-associated lipoprotein